MKISETENRGAVVIKIVGDMVGGPDARQLADRLRDYIDKGKKHFVVDMSDISWMNSSGLGSLMGGLSIVRNAGGNLKLLQVNEKIQNLLRITKLKNVFEVFDDEGKAIDSFSK